MTVVDSRPRRERSTGTRVAAWVVVVGLALLWAWRRLRQTYFHFDEWSMIDLTIQLDPIDGAIRSFNGHLYLLQDALYRSQVVVFGLDSNELVVVAFAVSLGARHLVVAALALRLGANDLSALLIGALLTYPGVASETFLFPWQVSPSFAAAASLAIPLAVIDREPTHRRTVVVAALVLAAVLLDSGHGLLALPLGGAVLVGCWPRRTWWALAPGAIVFALWTTLADSGPQFPGSLGERIEFGLRLIVRSAGGLIGGGATAGVVVLAAGGAAGAGAWRLGSLRGPALAVTIGGLLAASAIAAGISQSRAAIPGFTYFNFNRYLHNVGLPLAIAALPAAIAVARWVGERWMSGWPAAVRSAVVAVLVVAAWAGSLDEEDAYGDVLVEWNRTVEAAVGSTVSILRDGCPPGTAPDPDARPAGDVSPQLTVRLVAELVERGRLPTDRADADDPPDPAVVARICTPTATTPTNA